MYPYLFSEEVISIVHVVHSIQVCHDLSNLCMGTEAVTQTRGDSDTQDSPLCIAVGHDASFYQL